MVQGVAVQRVQSARSLGLVMDGNLKFEEHCLDLVRNCFYRLRILYSIRPYIDTELRIKLCESLILSKFNHCISVYGNCIYGKTLSLLQRVQNACARFCFTVPPRTHVTPFLNSSNILKLGGRVKYHLASLLFDVIHTKNPEYLNTKIPWRSLQPRYRPRWVAPVLYTPRHRTAAFRGSFKYQAAKIWNDLPPPIRGITIKRRFKAETFKYFLCQQKAEW